VQLYAQATAHEALSTDIAPIKERPLPPLYAKHAADIEAALKCIGPATATLDFTQSTEGAHSAASIAGKPYKSVNENRALKRGLSSTLYRSETQSADTKRTHEGLSTSVAAWYDYTSSWSGGSYTSHSDTSSISCNEPLFPLRVGKPFRLKATTQTVATSTGGNPPATTTRTVMDYTYDLELVEGPLGRDEIQKRYPFVTLQGPSAERWRIYRGRSKYQGTYRVLDMPDESKKAYQPIDRTREILYVEGPNVVIDLEPDYLQAGWKTSVVESP
jgi:hypothetical protein